MCAEDAAQIWQRTASSRRETTLRHQSESTCFSCTESPPSEADIVVNNYTEKPVLLALRKRVLQNCYGELVQWSYSIPEQALPMGMNTMGGGRGGENQEVLISLSLR